MSAPTVPLVFDRQRLRARRDICANTYHRYSFLKQNNSEALLERLADTPRQFPLALDLGCHDGTLARALASTSQVGAVIAADLSSQMAMRARGQGIMAACMSEEALAVKDGALDLITSALSLHWVNDLTGALIQIRRTLKPDGLFLASLFGAGTLAELRTCLIAAESEFTSGAAQRISPLPGLADMAGLMQRSGYALPVVDVDRLTVRYSSVPDLLTDLKGMGERAALSGSHPQGLSPRIMNRMGEIYAERFADPDGRIRASFEIVWLSGWAPGPGQPEPLKPGSATASLAKAVQSVSNVGKE